MSPAFDIDDKFELVKVDPNEGNWWAESNSKWDRRFMEHAKYVAQWSKDPSTKVGAVLVQEKTILSVGYNGFPRGVKDLAARYNDRETKYAFVAHAELNAILNCPIKPAKRSCKLYVWPTLMWPCACPDCAKAIIQCQFINSLFGYDEKDLVPRWEDKATVSRTMLYEACIRMVKVKKNDDDDTERSVSELPSYQTALHQS